MLALALLLLAGRALAQTPVTAESVLRQTTDRVMAVIDAARDAPREDADSYQAQMLEVLDPVVDYRGFARGVMGAYGSSERYRSLDEAGRERLREQLDRFTETMRTGLVRTYSRGLLAFGGARIETEYVGEPAAADATRAVLRQRIIAADGTTYTVVYQMGRDGVSGWQMRNLIVENVNLGQIYRSQFESAARRYDGDIDAVIANWSVEAAAGS